jgi:hypothetical protein
VPLPKPSTRIVLSRRYEKLLRAAVAAAASDCGKRMKNVGAPAAPVVSSRHDGDGAYVIEVKLHLPPADGEGWEEWV